MATEKENFYWLQGRHDDVMFECIEILHPSFSNPYRLVRNNAYGLSVTHAVSEWSNSEQKYEYSNTAVHDYEYVPATIKPTESSDNLEQGFTIGIGDVGEIMPQEIQRMFDGEYAHIRPVLNYRVYLSSDLTEPMTSVVGLQITDNSPRKEGAVFKCQAKEVNKTRTGVVYTIDQFPTLRGFL